MGIVGFGYKGDDCVIDAVTGGIVGEKGLNNGCQIIADRGPLSFKDGGHSIKSWSF